MKFAHMADCHIGGWLEPKLREIGVETFRQAIDICIRENVAFVLISGDLFDTSTPGVDLLKEVAHNLRKLRDNNIEVYIIAGSHDFSPSGKSMLDVMEKGGLLTNVVKFENDKLQFVEDKTGVKITGFLGKKGGLEINEYKELDKKSLEDEDGFKIFMFHSALEEYKPREFENVEGITLNDLPKGFKYYAGGHVHYIFDKKENKYGLIAFPGALFPNNFLEIEKFKHGGFYIVDDKLNLKYLPIKIKDVLCFNIDGKSAKEIENKILNIINKEDLNDKIITLRISGILEEGKVSDINFKELIKKMEDMGAYYVMKNTNKLQIKEFEEFDVDESNVQEIEDSIIKKHLGQIKINFDEETVIKDLMEVFSIEKEEDEKNYDFENRIINETVKKLKLENDNK